MFGWAVSVLPDGLPRHGHAAAHRASGDADSVVQGLRDEGFVLPHVDIDPEQLLNYLDPFVEPARHEFFRNRAWLRGSSPHQRVRGPDFAIGEKINLPPSYALIHRVWLGSIGVLCQLDATVPVRGEIERWVPDFTEPTPAGS